MLSKKYFVQYNFSWLINRNILIIYSRQSTHFAVYCDLFAGTVTYCYVKNTKKLQYISYLNIQKILKYQHKNHPEKPGKIKLPI